MESFVIEGGHTLKGSITPQGAKNEALQTLCAVLLTSEELTFITFLTLSMLTSSFNY